MSTNPKTKSDILLELFEGRFVGGALSQLANYSDLFMRMSEAVYLLDRHSYRVLECNPAACKLLKKEESELLGQVFIDFFPHGTALNHSLKNHLAIPFDFKGSTGERLYFELAATPLKILDYIEVIQVVVNDVTDVKRAQQELQEANSVLRKLSTTDEMTQLWNFRYFSEAIESVHHHAVASGENYAVVFIDVDHFKKFNDRNGHPAGDEVLRRVASILKSTTSSSQIAARYGGEEFVVLSRNSTIEEAQVTAEKIRQTIEESDFPFGSFQPLGKLSVSIGVAAYPAQGKTSAEVLQHADVALYQAKEEGRNRVVCYLPGMQKSSNKDVKKAS